MPIATRQVRRREKLLVLIRHGKAAPKNVGLSDFERVLIAKGARDCEAVAQKARQQGIEIDLMLSSPADRALESAHCFAKVLKYRYQHIKISDALYSSESAKSILVEIAGVDDSARVVALCGHNPAIDTIAAHLVPNFQGSVEKGAMLGIAVGNSPWRKLAAKRGTVRFMISPSEIKPHPKRKRQLSVSANN